MSHPDPNRPYWRAEIDREFAKVKSKMHQEATNRGGGRAIFQDSYTGKVLFGGDPYDYEHIRSSEEIFMKYRDRLTNDQIAKVVNCPENLGVTLRSINISKGKKRMEDWIRQPSVVADFGIDLELVRKVLEKADRGINELTIKILK
ncbi:hypothetical protein [Rhodonellum sp.]|uniref:hypothetical protein n=1 Tax=Rhodonellum sp. TaxID=2231180 RepID=UPI002726F7AF|nr:hypothetical protein [Rhodonellum sp.]MDO9552943.1 hypothetical protein [Rhodonellum sp.]